MADERIEINVRDALREIALLKGSLADVRSQMGQTRAAGEKAFGNIGPDAIKHAKEIEIIKNKYAEVKGAVRSLQDALKTAYDPRIINAYTKALGEAEAGLKKIENVAHTAGVSLKDVGKQGNEAGSAIKNVFLGSFAAGGLIAALELVKQGLQAGISQALEFEQGLADLSALTGIKGADLSGLEDIVKKLENINVKGQSIVTTGPEIERALALVGGAAPELLKNADALAAVTQQAIILSKSSKDLPLDAAVKAITTSMGQFNLVAADGSLIINAYAAASKAGSIEVPRLTRELADVGQVANLTGIGLEETLASIELLGKAKIPEGRIGVQLRNIFTILADAKSLPKDAQAAFQKFGVDTKILSDKTQTLEIRLKELQKINGDIPALSAIFGQQNIGGAAVLSTQADVLTKELIPAIKGTTEALDQAAIRADTSASSLSNLKNAALNGLGDTFSKSTGPLRLFTDGLVNLLTKGELIQNFFSFLSGGAIYDAIVKLKNLISPSKNLNPGQDTRTSLDPFAGDGRAEIEKKIKTAQQQSLSAQIELNAARQEAGQIEDKNAKIAKTAQKEREAEAKRLKAEREAELKAQEQFNREANDLRLQQLDPKSEQFAIVKELQRFDDQRAAFVKHNLDTEEIEKQHTKNLLKIELDFYLERQAKIEKSIQDEKDAIQRGFDELAGIAADDKERQKKNNEDVLRVRGEAQDLRAAIFEEQELSNKSLFFSKKRSDKEIEKYEKAVAKTREIFQLEQQANELQNLIEFDTTLSSAEKATLEQRVKNINTQIGQLKAGTGEKKDGKGLADLLGLSDRDLGNLESIRDSFVSVLQDIGAARLEEAEKAIEAAQMKVDAAQTAYDKEKELKDQGFANNLETATKNLEAAKAEEEKALKLKQDAQKKQLQLDTAMQLSSLVTAAANTFKGFSTIPLIGQILAVASVAAMFAAFAAARARASAATKFEKGGFVDEENLIHGNRHSDGGVMIEAEDGEFILNRKSSAKYPDIAKALNRGDESAILRAASRLNRDAVNGAIGEGKGSTVAIIAKDDKTAHGLLKQIRDKRGEGSTTIENGYSVTRTGNRTTRKRL